MDFVHPHEDAASIVESTAEAAFACDQKGRIVSWNGPAERLLGFDVDHTLGRACHELLSGADIFGNPYCRADCNPRAMVRCKQPIQSFKLDVQNASGEFVRVDVSVLALRTSQGPEYTTVHILRPSSQAVGSNHFLERLRSGVDSDAETAPDAAPSPPGDEAERLPSLTPREIGILRLLAAGSSPREIALRIGISIHTVRSHIQSCLHKLEVHSTTHVVSKALRRRLI